MRGRAVSPRPALLVEKPLRLLSFNPLSYTNPELTQTRGEPPRSATRVVVVRLETDRHPRLDRAGGDRAYCNLGPGGIAPSPPHAMARSLGELSEIAALLRGSLTPALSSPAGDTRETGAQRTGVRFPMGAAIGARSASLAAVL